MQESIRRISTIFLLISSLMLACSLTIPAPASTETVEPQYRFDNLPGKVNESSALSEYRL